MSNFLRLMAGCLGALVCVCAIAAQAGESQRLEKCRPGQPNTLDKHCVVDGDTYWFAGQKYRLLGVDTPEPQTRICGGEAEKALAARASARVIELLNSGPMAVQRHGFDRNKRILVTIEVGGRDLGQVLVAEGLARNWPDGHEFWCTVERPWWRRLLG